MKHIRLTKFNKPEVLHVVVYYEMGVMAYRYQPIRRAFDKQSGDLRGVYFKGVGLVYTKDLHIFSNTMQDGTIKGLFNELLNPVPSPSRHSAFPYYKTICSQLRFGVTFHETYPVNQI